MIHAGGTIPGCIHVPLHIRIIGKKLTLAVDRSIVLVTKTGGHNFPGFSFRVNLSKMPERSDRALHEILQGWI